ncbi:transposase [Desulfococcaceae bacterium HSG9]|nr:transposase [Desulfococcaceae bacterium HSG9]
MTEFEYQCSGRKRPRRFIAVRELFEITYDELFPEIPKYEYRYFSYVTDNRRLTPCKAHKKYGKCSTGENRIERCQNQMAAGTVLTQKFQADSAVFQTCVPAYNLTVRMMRLTPEHRFSEEPNTIRFRLIRVPARLLTGGKHLILKLSKNRYFKNRQLTTEHSSELLTFT